MLLVHGPWHELRLHHHRYVPSHRATRPPTLALTRSRIRPPHPPHPDTALRNLKVSSLNPLRWFRNDTGYADEDDEDLTPAADRVPTLWWTTGLAASVVLCCAILATLFHMNVGEAILALILGFAFSFVGVQSAGTTDVNPVTAVAKVRAQGCEWQFDASGGSR